MRGNKWRHFDPPHPNPLLQGEGIVFGLVAAIGLISDIFLRMMWFGGRDSRDSKYFVNPKHPQHNAYVQQQKQNNGNHPGQNKGNVAPKGNVPPRGSVAPRGNNGNNRSPVIKQNTRIQSPTTTRQNPRIQSPTSTKQNPGNQRPTNVRQKPGNQKAPAGNQNKGNKGNGGKGNGNNKENDKGNGKGK